MNVKDIIDRLMRKLDFTLRCIEPGNATEAELEEINKIQERIAFYIIKLCVFNNDEIEDKA